MKKPLYYRQFNYNRRLLPNDYLAELEMGVSSIDEATRRTGYSVGYPGWNLMYYATLCHLDKNTHNIIVETGSNVGCSTIILAQALKDSGAQGRVYTIEAKQEAYEQAQRNVRAARVEEWVESYLGDSKRKLSELVSRLDAKIRVAFLDASHHYADVLREFELVLPHMQRDGIVIFDNTYPLADPGDDPLVHGALKYIQARHGGHVVNFPYASWYTPGIAIWQSTPWIQVEQESKPSMVSPLETRLLATTVPPGKPGWGADELVEAIRRLFPLLTARDVAKGLRHAFHIQSTIEGRCCGDVGDRLAQYGAWVQFLRERKGAEAGCGIEIGTLYGGSSMLMLQAARDEGSLARMICIDPMKGFYEMEDASGVPVSPEVFHRNMRGAGFDTSWYELRPAFSHQPEARQGLRPGSCGVLLIDGDHSYDGVMSDWNLYRDTVAEGGFVLFDDYSDPAWPGVTACVNDISNALPSDWVVIGQLGTTMVLRRKAAGTTLSVGRAAPEPVRDWNDMVASMLEAFNVFTRIRLAAHATLQKQHAIDDLKSQMADERKQVATWQKMMNAKQKELRDSLNDMVSGWVKYRWNDLKRQHHMSTVYLFGGGKHTGWLLNLVQGQQGPRVIGILDDHAADGEHRWGIPVFKPETVKGTACDGIVLSTDSLQDLFAQRCAEVFSGAYPVVDLYDALPRSRPLLPK